jgi:hypothetical protein
VTRPARPYGLNMVERALLAQRWRKESVSAGIHAMIGEDAEKLVNTAGKTAYVILGACAAANLSHDLPDIRILRGAVNAIYDQADQQDIPEHRRASIVSGLEACNRLLPLLTQRQVSDAALDLELRLLHGDVHYSDFLALIEGTTA